MKALIICVALTLLALTAESYIVSGHLKTSDEFTLVGRFCFSTGTQEAQNAHGIYIDEAVGSFTNGASFWAAYFDSAASWGANYNNKSRSCWDKLRSASWHTGLANKSIELHPHNYARPHIWYVVLLNCPFVNQSAAKPIDVTYKVKFINVDGSQVGNDESGMLPLNAVYFTFFFLVLAVHAIGAYFLWLKRSLHPIVQILLICLALVTIAAMFIMIHWAIYPKNGTGCPGCRVFGQLLNGFSNVIFATLLCMIASGWAITFHTLPRRNIIIGIFASYLLFFIVVFSISTSQATSAASTQLVYARGAILGLVIVYILVCWLGVCGYFVYSLYLTFREETQYDKRLFYLIFGIGYGCWFILPALLNFISIGVDEWFRPRVVDAFQYTATFIGMVMLVVLLWPSRVEKYFRIVSPDLLTSDPSTI